MPEPTRVLHVEDDDRHADFVRAVLDAVTPGEFTLVRAASLAEAVDSVSRLEFDVLLLDLSLPDAQGFAALEQMTTSAAHLPLVVFSARDDDASMMASLDHHAAEVLVKGRDEPEALPRALRSALRRHRPAADPAPAAEPTPLDPAEVIGEFVAAMAGGDGLQLHYQPKINLLTGAVSGVEALIRWTHPTWGRVRPDHFIPVIEHSEHALDLTRWTITRALADRRTWAGRDTDVTVAVNVPGSVLGDLDLDVVVTAALNEADTEPARLVLELTETAVVADPQQATAALQRLDDLGVMTSIDDFGAGYGSLTYLSRFPVREVKIDRLFVSSIDESPTDAAIVESTLDLAQSLGLKTVAEGIETRDIAERLQQLRCTTGQGYMFWPALPAADLKAIIASDVPWLSPLPNATLDLDEAIDRRSTSVLARALRRMIRARSGEQVVAVVQDAVVELGGSVGPSGSDRAIEIDLSLGFGPPVVPIAPVNTLILHRLQEVVPALVEDARLRILELDRLLLQDGAEHT